MPNRILREGILTSPRMAKLGWAEEVFYRRLHSVVDDFGRYYADVGLLRAACYPRQLNKVSDSDIGKWLSACAAAALVRVYPAQDGESYLEVLDFAQQVRAKKSRFPDALRTCAASAAQLPGNPPADAPVFVFGDVSVGEGVSVVGAANAAPTPVNPVPALPPADPPTQPPPAPPLEATAKRALRKCPAGFELTPALLAWAAENAPAIDASKETAAFLDHTFANAITDWPGAWRNWMRKAQTFAASRRPASASRHAGFGAKDYREGVTEDGHIA